MSFSGAIPGVEVLVHHLAAPRRLAVEVAHEEFRLLCNTRVREEPSVACSWYTAKFCNGRVPGRSDHRLFHEPVLAPVDKVLL